jgi:hypothetical protein
VALTMWHMLFCSALAFVIIKLGYVEPIGINRETYIRCGLTGSQSRGLHGGSP